MAQEIGLVKSLRVFFVSWCLRGSTIVRVLNHEDTKITKVHKVKISDSTPSQKSFQSLYF